MAKASCPQCKTLTAASAHACPSCDFPLTPPQPVTRRLWSPNKSGMSNFSKALLVVAGVFAALIVLAD